MLKVTGGKQKPLRHFKNKNIYYQKVYLFVNSKRP